MSPEEILRQSLRDNPPAQTPPSRASTRARLENIAVIRADKTSIDLGRPGTIRFRLRLAKYKRSLRG